MDIGSTYFAVRYFDALELNRHTDARTLVSLIGLDPILIGVAGCMSAVAERHIRRLGGGPSGYGEFLARVGRSWNALPWYFLVLLGVLVVTRLAAAGGNLLFIAFGHNPLTWISDSIAGLLGTSRGSGLPITFGLLAALLCKPVGAYLHRQLPQHPSQGGFRAYAIAVICLAAGAVATLLVLAQWDHIKSLF